MIPDAIRVTRDASSAMMSLAGHAPLHAPPEPLLGSGGVVRPRPLPSGAVTDEATVRAMFDRLGADRSTAAHARIADAWAAMSEHNRRLFVAGFAEALRARDSTPVDAPGDEAVWGLEALGALVDDDRRFPDPR